MQTNDAHRSSFHNLNNLVDVAASLQLKVEQHNSRKRRPSLFVLLTITVMKGRKKKLNKKLKAVYITNTTRINLGREELSDSVDFDNNEPLFL